ncbi:substrate-binding periplasmic protein [Aeromonas crassostreae]
MFGIHTIIGRALGLGLLLALSLPLGAKETLSVAWSHWPPLSQIDANGEIGGLDVTLTRQILKDAGLTPRFRNLPWARTLHLIERRQLDVAMGALDTPERRGFARFSAPYRRASFVLLSHLPAPEAADPWRGITGLADLCRPSGLRLGKLRGTRPLPLGVPCPSLGAAREYNSDDRLIALLLARRLDGVIMEWQYTHHRLTQLGANDFIRCQLLLHQQPVSLMFAREAVSDEELARIDAAIAALPPLDAAFAPPVCRLDGSRARDDVARS